MHACRMSSCRSPYGFPGHGRGTNPPPSPRRGLAVARVKSAVAILERAALLAAARGGGQHRRRIGHGHGPAYVSLGFSVHSRVLQLLLRSCACFWPSCLTPQPYPRTYPRFRPPTAAAA